jgi:putative ABC transport system substrate-binding protein
LVLLAALLLPTSLSAAELNVAVLYPDVGDPYRKVFLEIIRGVETELQQPIKPYPIEGDKADQATLAERLKQDHIDVAIALGNAGYTVAQTLTATLPTVVGAVLLAPGADEHGLSGISLSPDPALLFSRLKELAPGAREVAVIYDPDGYEEEIRRAQEAAKSHGLTLHALPATDVRENAAHYQELLEQIKNGSVALWLPQANTAMDEQALLPVVLREAWDKSFVVFSSNLDHVRKGALFS